VHRTALAVFSDLPDPPRSGNHLRDLQTLVILEELGLDVSVVAGDHAPGSKRTIGSRGQLIQTVPIAPASTSTRARIRRLAQLGAAAALPSRPGPWALDYEDAGLSEAVVGAVETLRPDVVLLRSTLGHLAPRLRRHVDVLVFDVHDAETFQAMSVLRLTTGRRRPVGLLRLAAARRTERLIRLADEAWVPSQPEIAHLTAIAPGPRILLVPNGVEIDEEFPIRRPGRELLLVGGFGYPPNQAAAIRLVEEVLPLVLKSHPDVSVTLVGRDLSPALGKRWAAEPVRWHGVVDDLQPFYDRAAALVLAYDASTSTGTPLKIAEAIAKGVPVVATPNATEPLGLSDELHVLTGSTGAELAAAVARVLANPRRSEERARRAHDWGRRTLDPRALAQRLRRDSILGGAISAPESEAPSDASEDSQR
jgi:glycosyltransferase involved in cell wall biosynthesis